MQYLFHEVFCMLRMHASHACFAGRVIADSRQWAVVLKVLVQPSSYRSYDPTAGHDKHPTDGEPSTPEYRVSDTAIPESIFRIGLWSKRLHEAEWARNVVVQSVIFADVDFLDNITLSFEDVCRLFTH